MPDKKINIVINKLNEKLAVVFNNFIGTYLYGSMAKGTYTENSDVDIIIIFSEKLSYEEERKLAGIIGLLEYESDLFIDYHPYTMNDLEKNPIFLREVVEKGIYYEAA
ncbi:MAG: nucleotidyltransferase domain-containing protein [bacterium]